jgi:spore germination protein PF
MPSFVGIFNIIRNEGNLINGDTCIIAPTSASKTYTGAGGGISGDVSFLGTVFSATITVYPEVGEAGANKTATGT